MTMLKYYFLTKIPSLKMAMLPPMSLSEFSFKACETLSKNHLRDFLLLQRYVQIHEVINKQFVGDQQEHLKVFGESFFMEPKKLNSIDTLWLEFWLELQQAVRSKFIKQYAEINLELFGYLSSASKQKFFHLENKIGRYKDVPLRFHEEIERYLWEQIEALSPMDPFHVDQVFVYYLKLFFLTRQADHIHEKGLELMKQFDELLLKEVCNDGR